MAASCQHLHFEAAVNVIRLEDMPGGDGAPALTADIHIRCAECKTRAAFVGFPMGVSVKRAMVSVDRLELRVPLEMDAFATSMMADPAHPWPPRPHGGEEPPGGV